jgi:hypothetical protein
MAAPKTTLDTDNTKPSKTAPGDGAADTTDPLERASTVLPQPGPEALRAGTVNSQLPLAPIPDSVPKRSNDDRVEEYEVTDAAGNVARVVRNVETGERRFSKGADTGAIQTQNANR